MKDLNVYNIKRCLPRMSWHPRNLYNLWRRSVGDKSAGTDFRTSRSTLFQARWQSKALVRAYHGDFINEGIFKRWYLPQTLPDVRPRRQIGRGDDRMELAAMAGRGRDVQREVERVKEDERHALAPVGSLMFGEVERRIDVFLFRCCFAHSVYEARRLVIHGDVKLNGVKHQDANTRLAPGDMISVDPAAIRFLRPSKTVPSSIFAPEKDATGKSEPKMSAWDQVLALSEDEPTSSTPAATEASSSEISPEEPKASEEPEAPQDPRLKGLTPFHLPPFAAPHLFLPAYAEVSFATCSAVLVRLPTARAEYSEIPTPYEADGEVVRFAWEWYAGRRPRVRSARQRAQSPINRQRSDEPVVGRN